MYEYLIISIACFIPWIGMYLMRPDLRKPMIHSSLIATPFGLTQAFYVPDYWDPQAILKFTLFGTTFDVESLLFCFAFGGVAATIFEFLVEVELKQMPHTRALSTGHFYVFLAVTNAVAWPSYFFFDLGFIYTSILSMAAGAITMMYFRKDLIMDVMLGGTIFLVYYFILFAGINLVIPGWVAETWNFQNFWGVQILGVPMGEIAWAFVFGAVWSPLFEFMEAHTTYHSY